MPYRKYVRKYWKGFLLGITFLLLEAAVDLLLPTLLALIIDRGIANNDMDYVLRMGGIMLLVTALGAVAAATRNVLAVWVSQRFGTELRSDLFACIQRLSFARINRFERASLITRMTNDITIVQNFVGGMMRVFVKAPLLGIGALILAINLNVELSLVFVVIVPIVVVLVAFSMKIGFRRFTKVQQSLDRVNGAVREYLSGVRVVKAFNRFGYEVERFEDANEEQRRVSVSAMLTMAIFNPAIMLVVNLGVVVILWIGGNWILGGQMQGSGLGELVAFINYMTQILFALMMVSMLFTMFARARAGASRINEVFLQEDSGERSTNSARSNSARSNSAAVGEGGTGSADRVPLALEADADAQPVVQQGGIVFEGVDFAYPGAAGPPVLRHISFVCEPGETIALIGSTGSGKSSLIQLIPRFYDPDAGRITIDGQDTRQLSPARLREQIAIVPQKTMLFAGSIADNIRWGDELADDEAVAEAGRMAEADTFITALPEGYNTQLGQRGVNLSGGQKQRIAIARALIRKPRILILDDCTSALDSATENAIKSSLRRYSVNLTCILIAQRITSVMDADKIVVLDRGEVVGVGTHAQLLESCTVYQEIYESQFGKELQTHERRF